MNFFFLSFVFLKCFVEFIKSTYLEKKNIQKKLNNYKNTKKKQKQKKLPNVSLCTFFRIINSFIPTIIKTKNQKKFNKTIGKK